MLAVGGYHAAVYDAFILGVGGGGGGGRGQKRWLFKTGDPLIEMTT